MIRLGAQSLGGGAADLDVRVAVGAVNSTQVFAFDTAGVTAFNLSTEVVILSVLANG